MRVFLLAVDPDLFSQALGNMIVGILVVFAALLFLCGVISLFKLIGKANKTQPAKKTEPVKTEAPAKAAEPAKPASGVEDEVIAVILAAVAQKCGPNAKVTSIQKSN